MTDQPDANGVLQAVFDRANNALRVSGSAAVTFAGDLSGTSSSQEVEKIQGSVVAGDGANGIYLPLPADSANRNFSIGNPAVDNVFASFDAQNIPDGGSTAGLSLFGSSHGKQVEVTADARMDQIAGSTYSGILSADLGASVPSGTGWKLLVDETKAQIIAAAQVGQTLPLLALYDAIGTLLASITASGALTTSPPSSHTATLALGALAVGTPLQNTLGYDIMVTGTVNVTAATAGSLKLGVDASATPTTDPITGSITTAALSVVSFSAIVPNNYYISLQSAGTITLASPVIVATPL